MVLMLDTAAQNLAGNDLQVTQGFGARLLRRQLRVNRWGPALLRALVNAVLRGGKGHTRARHARTSWHVRRHSWHALDAGHVVHVGHIRKARGHEHALFELFDLAVALLELVLHFLQSALRFPQFTPDLVSADAVVAVAHNVGHQLLYLALLNARLDLVSLLGLFTLNLRQLLLEVQVVGVVPELLRRLPELLALLNRQHQQFLRFAEVIHIACLLSSHQQSLQWHAR